MLAAADDYAETPEGLLFLADGLSTMKRWDGISSVTYPVGVTAPATALSMAIDGTAVDPAPTFPPTACTIAGDHTALPVGDPASATPMVGTYVAYVRWARDDGIFSALSPISNTLVLQSAADIIAAAVAVATSGAVVPVPTTAVYNAAKAAEAAAIAAYNNALVNLNNVNAHIINNPSDPNNPALLAAANALVASTLATLNAALVTVIGYAEAFCANALIAQNNANAAVTAATNGAGPPGTVTGQALANAQTAATAASTAYSLLIAGDLTSYISVQVSLTTPSTSPGYGAAVTTAVDAAVAAIQALSASTLAAANATGTATGTAAATAAAVYGLVYTNVPIPPAGITQRQILRNANGDLNTLYVDVDTSDVTSTTLRTKNYDSDIENADIILANGDQSTPGLDGTYYAFVRFVNDMGVYSNFSPISNTLILDSAQHSYGLVYTNVPVPTQANVVRRQILRNSSGEAAVFYVDIDTTDLVSTTFRSVKFDPSLTAGEAQPLFDVNGVSLANSHGPPPSFKTAMAHHLGRMFLTADKLYTRGGVAVVNGSPTVQGLNTDWTDVLVNRYLWVRGATQSYQIAAVNATAQTLTLTANFTDPSNPFADYSIAPPPAERRLVYYTQAADAESWPAINALSLQEDGDEITGLMVKGSFLYILESRHIYRFTFQSDPANDGFIFLSAVRGCVNNRCWVIAEEMSYMLDHSGIFAFDGTDPTSISDPIQHLWRSEASGPQINWQAEELFFAVHSADEQYIRWFVCLAGERFPRHAICLSYREKRFWVEEYDRPLSAGCEGTFEYRRRGFAGGEANKCYLGWQSPLEGIDPSSGLTRGTVASATARTLTDAVGSGAWPATLVGQTVSIVSGRGEGQMRRICDFAGDTLHIIGDWQTMPDSTSVYQFGGIPWVWQSGWMRLAQVETDNSRRIEVVFDVADSPSSLTLRIYRDFSDTPVAWHTSRKARDNEGFSSQVGSPDLIAEMAVTRGFAQQRMDGHKEMNAEGTRFISVELSGTSSKSEQSIRQVIIDGVES